MSYFAGVLITLFVGTITFGYQWHEIQDTPNVIARWVAILLVGSVLWPAAWLAVLAVIVFWSLWRIGVALHNLIAETKNYFKGDK